MAIHQGDGEIQMRASSGTTVSVSIDDAEDEIVVRGAGERWTFAVDDGVAQLVDGTYATPEWIDGVLRRIGVRVGDLEQKPDGER